VTKGFKDCDTVFKPLAVTSSESPPLSRLLTPALPQDHSWAWLSGYVGQPCYPPICPEEESGGVAYAGQGS
jgi:hypothetical protein